MEESKFVCPYPLIEFLYKKRYCLPNDIDVEECKNGNIPRNNFMLHINTYNHIACIFQGKVENSQSGKNIHVLSYGINIYADVEGINSTIHAEYNAVTKLPSLPNNRKRLCQCNIMVVRLSKTTRSHMSRPCYRCLTNLVEISEKKGYKIKHVYYTDSDEKMVKTTLHKMLNDTQYYTRYQRNQKQSSIDCCHHEP